MYNRVEELKIIKEHLKGDNVLDIGTGDGSFLKLIIDNCPTITSAVGIDVKDLALESAESEFNDKRVKFQKAGCENIPFEKNSFDIIGISNTLHHLRNKQICMSEISRVLKKGGFLLVNEQIPEIKIEKQKIYHLSHNLAIDMDEQSGTDHFPIYTKSEIECLFPDDEYRIIDSAEYTINITADEMEEYIPEIIKHHKSSLAKLKDNAMYDSFNKRLNELINALNSIGFDDPSHYFMLLQKQ